ncbi:MAG: hypothetical protein A1D16_17770 [Flavihumibacter sp. CACIAM 22H1]|nr:MAG: hypothetical protein A1D16_17770 [Flavihumibacter sp. CACIAM 22H1]
MITYNTAVEESFARSVSIVDKVIKNPPGQSDAYLFIDVSRSKKLVELEDATGNLSITDRMRLATFFSLITADTAIRPKAVICDLLFDLSTEDDDTLQRAMEKLRPLLIPFGEDDNGPLLPVFKKIETGYAGYLQSSGWEASEKLVKYHLWPEQNKPTIPLKLKANIDGENFARSGGFIWNGKGIYYANLIPSFTLRKEPAYAEGASSFYYLKELTDLFQTQNKALLAKFIRNRIIFLGDFENDVHDTYEGKYSGTHILANVFQSFDKGENQITLGWLLYVAIFSMLVALYVYFAEMRDLEELTEAKRKPGWQKNAWRLFKLLSITGVLWIGCFFSFFKFSVFLNPLLVMICLGVVLAMKKRIQFLIR